MVPLASYVTAVLELDQVRSDLSNRHPAAVGKITLGDFQRSFIGPMSLQELRENTERAHGQSRILNRVIGHASEVFWLCRSSGIKKLRFTLGAHMTPQAYRVAADWRARSLPAEWLASGRKEARALPDLCPPVLVASHVMSEVDASDVSYRISILGSRLFHGLIAILTPVALGHSVLTDRTPGVLRGLAQGLDYLRDDLGSAGQNCVPIDRDGDTANHASAAWLATVTRSMAADPYVR